MCVIGGNNTKKYTVLNFVGVETIANPINASAMTIFTDVWSLISLNLK
jgi:hypothetical protein